MPITYLPADHHVVRYVPWARLRKTEDDVVIGVLGMAFKLRENEDYLSATWMEFAQEPTRRANLEGAVKIIRASNIDVRPKSGFAIGNVGKVKDICLADARRHKIRTIHQREDDNEAHVALRGWPQDNDDLLELVAEEPWSEVVLNTEIPD